MKSLKNSSRRTLASQRVQPLLRLNYAAGLILLVLAWVTVVSPVHARLFHHQKTAAEEAVEKVQTFQAPAADAMTRYCEPYRAKAAALSQKPFFIRPFYGPQRMWLISKHQKCRYKVMDQEHVYLKHVDIEQAPSLPKLNPGAPKPGVPNGNL